eukprot:gb/GECG01003081.1/.p1 GENE.gb/GECG01003081.1/~~gb/GECG01003081.1/.p1  ORF type:complete len:378 (+),score=44.59 gb/GECG01003081.1/:1-1134(+)
MRNVFLLPSLSKGLQRGALRRISTRRLFHSTHDSGSANKVGSLQSPGDGYLRTVTVFPGHGIGPELTAAAQRVVDATNAPVEWEVVDNITNKLTPEAYASLRKNHVALKGEFQVGVGKGSMNSINVELRREMELYANVVHSFPLPGTNPRHEGVDIVMIRESTEGEYSGMEHEVAPGITEALKVMTKAGTRRIAEYAFEYAYLNRRGKVTAVHKANIMKRADGLFLDSCREVAKNYPNVKYEEVIVDNCMMQLVSKPQQFDVMVTPNFYGSLVSNVVAGLVGGPGLVPGATIGKETAIFEQGARHLASDIAGTNTANPTGMLFAAVMMLRHIRLPVFADSVEDALFYVLEHGSRPRDIGGNASLSEFVDAVCEHINK